MKDFASKKAKYFCEYADSISDKFKKLRYGISACCHREDFDLVFMRYELATWQSSLDYSTLSQLKTRLRKWLPINFDDNKYCHVNINIIDSAAAAFKIEPATDIWIIHHDLPFIPNVTTTDLTRKEIQGTVEYPNDTTVKITFSSPVAGWAYLS